MTRLQLRQWLTNPPRAPGVMQATDSAEALLHICRKLWHQPYIAPVYALLLHQWLLLKKDAGGWEQRQKHVNVLVLGEGPAAFLPLQC